MEIKSNGALFIDDKVTLIENLSEPTGTDDKTEYGNLRYIQNFFLFNNIPLYILKDIGDYPAEAISNIQSIPDVDLLIVDLDLNSNGDFDDYDASLMARILSELKRRFGKIPIMVYSSLADQWDVLKKTIISNDESISDLLTEDNIWVVKKGAGNSSETLLETINKNIKIRTQNNIDLHIESAINTSKYWRLEWALILACFIAFIGVTSLVFTIKKSLLVMSIFTVILLAAKLIYKEYDTISKLKKLNNRERNNTKIN